MTKRARATHPLQQPYLLFLIFVGVGLGTLLLGQAARLAVMWATLVILSLLYSGRQAVELDFSLSNVGRGALLGAVIGVPLLAFLPEPLRVFSERLYGTNNVVLLFYQVCFVAAPVEEYFFRGVIQGSLGPSVSIGLYAATALLLFVPHAPVLAALIVFLAMGLLGIVYSNVRERHGLAATISCHIVVGFVLQVLPSMLGILQSMLA
ncbi:MAG: CPBP family intramembrane glutamic endopeptidase [Anaerolineae bacterium]